MITNVNKQNYNDIETQKWTQIHQLIAKLMDIEKIMVDVQEIYKKQVDEEASKWYQAMGAIWEMDVEIQKTVKKIVEKEAIKSNEGGQHEIIQKC